MQSAGPCPLTWGGDGQDSAQVPLPPSEPVAHTWRNPAKSLELCRHLGNIRERP